MPGGQVVSTRVFALQRVVRSQSAQSVASEVLHQTGVSRRPQSWKSPPLVKQAREPRSFPRCRKRGAGAPVAKGQSGLLETDQEVVQYVTRSRPSPSSCATTSSSQDISSTVTRSLRHARSSAGWSYLSFDRLTVTRSRGANHSASASQGENHSGHEVRGENQRKS